ncbi:hypothetical protein J2S40_001932 [Nocardioides luteus]|uniref:Secreted protein n=1 Tax=Nocardioides luteus TaxID=1844 RepID=A0ABQ5T2E6_9ACTN|nr:DUF6167 family protein [Nocardioides luteus]MDR7310874.1 hypothetical protein [Nocardioides luteus]GGR40067.1 hypothetical protein GCM10010197_01220 [Nocardioides luteus]GLJ69346.1 hypothetical protein GCM10017579_33820 [Nocardioides luteus]
MRGAIWFVVGAGAGVYAMVKGRRAAEAFTADGLRDRAQALGVGARIFREELATGKAEKELELREWIEARTPAIAAGSAPAEGRKQIGAEGAEQTRLGLNGPTEDPRQDTEGSTP